MTSNGNPHLAAALNWLDMGFSPLPPRDDGSKAPLADQQIDGEWTWAPYQQAPTGRNRVEAWYRNGRTGNGVATGVGGLELFEFDDHQVYEQFKAAAAALGLGELVERIEAGYLEVTPGGGVHWFYVCDEIRGSTKLAERPVPGSPHKRDPLIETKGQGGFAVVAPSCGKVHPSGGAYRLLQGRPDLIATVTAGERQALWDLAVTFDEMPVAEPAAERSKVASGDDARPGDAYAAEHSWEDILEPLGWVKSHTRGDVTYWRRPGKGEGISATTGHCRGLYVFSTSTSFEPRRSYTKFGAYAHLNHGGDHQAAAKELGRQGYGQQQQAKARGKGKPGAGAPESVSDSPGYICNRSGEPTSCASNTKLWLRENKPEDFARYDRFRQAILIDGSPLTDQAVIDLAMEIEAAVQAPWSQEHVRSALAHLAHQREFSSLVQWLESLRWDRVERVSKFFADHYESAETEYTAECARVFFLSAVARAYEPGCQADIMPVLIGPQGIGKSTGMAALCPNPDWFADDLGCDLFAGKAAEGLLAKWIFEFGEFARINRSTLDVVKSFITRRVDRYRPPYGRMAQDFPRSCVFFGTTNTRQPLQDIENRRFFPIEVVQGNVPAIRASRDQLWAEAVHRYKGGEKWHVTSSNLLAEISSNLESARSEDAWEAILREKLDGLSQTTMIEAAAFLGLWNDRACPPVNRLGRPEQTRIGNALAAIGFVSKRQPKPPRARYYERESGPTSP